MICCLADRELADWSARCFMATGLNSIACCTVSDLDRYAGSVQADAIVLDDQLALTPAGGQAWRRWTVAGGVACLLGVSPAEADAVPPAGDTRACSVMDAPPDLVFSKPLNCDQMAHDLMTLLRRPAAPADLRADLQSRSVSSALQLDLRWCQVLPLPPFGTGRSVQVSEQEYRLLHALLQHAGKVLSRETLLSALVKGGTGAETLRSVDQVVRRLRDALAPVGLDAGLATVRGEGYRWVDPLPPDTPPSLEP